MPVMFIVVVGIGVALLRRRLLVAPEERASEDAPARLLGWAVGLLAAQRYEWGQAMIGELDRLDGTCRGRSRCRPPARQAPDLAPCAT